MHQQIDNSFCAMFYELLKMRIQAAKWKMALSIKFAKKTAN